MTTIGTQFSYKRTFSQAEFTAFGQLSGDNNPIHIDPEFAAKTRFGRTVAHGMMLYSTLRGLLATHFPDWQQKNQELMFPAPTFAGDEMEIAVEVTGGDGEKTISMATQVTRITDGTITCNGHTTLYREETPSC